MKYLLLLSTVLLAACSKPTQPAVQAPKRLYEAVDFQGHRGARGLAPENTLAAFITALDLGVTTLELDVVVSRDSQLIVSHEPWFNPEICSGQDGKSLSEDQKVGILSLTAQEIQAYDCGSRKHPRFPSQQNRPQYKPTLAEVVDSVHAFCRANNQPLPRWNIETKHTVEWEAERLVPDAATFARLLVHELDRMNITASTTIQSFSPATLQAAQRINQQLTLCLLVENTEGYKANIERLGFEPAVYSPYYELVTSELIDSCHQAGMQVIPWTVNELADMRRMLDLGVDGLISDYPNRFADLPEFQPTR